MAVRCECGTTLENDERYYMAYDERWRVVATFRNADANPKERFVHHAAGRGGYGSSSYIDSVALRDRDANSGRGSAADGTLEERRYYLQNLRADVSVMTDTLGDPQEWIKYSSYGVPYCISKGDYDCDGDVDSADTTELNNAISGGAGWWKDFNQDGSDVTDHATYVTGYTDGTAGKNVQSSALDQHA